MLLIKSFGFNNKAAIKVRQFKDGWRTYLK